MLEELTLCRWCPLIQQRDVRLDETMYRIVLMNDWLRRWISAGAVPDKRSEGGLVVPPMTV